MPVMPNTLTGPSIGFFYFPNVCKIINNYGNVDFHFHKGLVLSCHLGLSKQNIWLTVTIATIVVVVIIVVIVIFTLDVGLWNCSNISCLSLQRVGTRKKTKSEESNVEYETLKSQDYIRMWTCEQYSLHKTTSHKTQEIECYNLKYDDI